jgi:peptide deformylase
LVKWPYLRYNLAMIRKILDVKDSRLRNKSKPVTVIDKRIKKIAKDLKDTLSSQKDPEGVGLAAVQIGKNIRMFAMVTSTGIKIVVNPEILSTKEGKNVNKLPEEDIMEGCLSILNYYGPLKRAQEARVKYQDLDGKDIVETFSGLQAQIVQHEVDHLNGILFTDRLLEQEESLYKFNGKDWEEVEI